MLVHHCQPEVQDFSSADQVKTASSQASILDADCCLRYPHGQGIEKTEFFTKLTGNPGILLTDCQPVYQAKLKLDKGQFSSNRRLQSLLSNILAKRYSIQLLSAKLLSSLLKLVDFGSRNPVLCNLESCTICKEDHADVLLVSVPTPNLDLGSLSAWK